MRIGAFMKRISAIAEQLDFNRAWELTILAAFRKCWSGIARRACFRSRRAVDACIVAECRPAGMSSRREGVDGDECE